MSSLWTPSGEHFPKEEGTDAAPPPFTAAGEADVTGPSQAEAQAEVDAMRAQLANTPAEVVVANHCYGLFELAAIYLSHTPPMLFQARLAIDGLGALLEGLARAPGRGRAVPPRIPLPAPPGLRAPRGCRAVPHRHRGRLRPGLGLIGLGPARPVRRRGPWAGKWNAS